MAKNFYISIIFFLLLTLTAHSQTGYLEVKKKSNEKTKLIPQGRKIHIICKDSSSFKGEFTIQNDSVINISGNSIQLDSISQLQYRSLGKKILTYSLIGTGFSMGTTGVAFIGMGAVFFTMGCDIMPLFGLVIGIGGGVLGLVSIIPYQIGKYHLKKSKRFYNTDQYSYRLITK